MTPSLSTAIQGIFGLGASGSQVGGPQRVPLVFTSSLRQLAARTTQRAAEGLSEAQLANLTNDNLSFENYPGYRSLAFMPSIAMMVNPNSIKVSQTKRIVKKDTREGSVFFHFTNSKGQNNDIATISASGNTGNLDLRGSVGTGGPVTGPDTGALQKLIVWHNLLLLTREPMLLPDNTENLFTITYASKVFPIQLDLNGHFSKVLEWEESAKKPNSMDYSWEFTVTSTEPDLDEWLSIFGDTLATPAFNNTGEIASAQRVGHALGIAGNHPAAEGVFINRKPFEDHPNTPWGPQGIIVSTEDETG